MRLVRAETDAIHAPGMCFICEAPPAPTRPLVDTEREWHPPPDSPMVARTHLHGAKYVCSDCVSALCACAYGKSLPGLVADRDALLAQLEAASARMAEVEQMDVAVDQQLRRLIAERTFVKPGPKSRRAQGQL